MQGRRAHCDRRAAHWALSEATSDHGIFQCHDCCSFAIKSSCCRTAAQPHREVSAEAQADYSMRMMLAQESGVISSWHCNCHHMLRVSSFNIRIQLPEQSPWVWHRNSMSPTTPHHRIIALSHAGMQPYTQTPGDELPPLFLADIEGCMYACMHMCSRSSIMPVSAVECIHMGTWSPYVRSSRSLSALLLHFEIFLNSPHTNWGTKGGTPVERVACRHGRTQAAC
jgi:hypothetical protein